MLKVAIGIALVMCNATSPSFAGLISPRPENIGLVAVIEVGCAVDKPMASGERHVRRTGNCDDRTQGGTADMQRKFVNRRVVDCHRDVRTHRVGGIMLKHRHVGDDCEIREVRTAN